MWSLDIIFASFNKVLQTGDFRKCKSSRRVSLFGVRPAFGGGGGGGGGGVVF